MPVRLWREGRWELPLVFAGSSAAAAGGAAALATPPGDARLARLTALAGTLVEGAATQLMVRRAGPAGRPLRNGRLALAAKTLSGAGALTTAVVGGRRRAFARAGGAMLVAGELLERAAVIRAGIRHAQRVLPARWPLPQG